MMCFRVPLGVCLAGLACLNAADERQLALGLRAQSDYDRVELSARPQIQDTSGCVQSQAAAIAVAARAELASLYFRKGYCLLTGAKLTGRAADSLEAAAAFDKSIETWPEAMGRNPRNGTPQPVSSGLRILAAVSRLEAEPAAGAPGGGMPKQEIRQAVEAPACPTAVMPASLCQSMITVGREWLGWMALQQGDLGQASGELAGVAQSPWKSWAAGQQAFHDRNYQEASAFYQQAVEQWQAPPSGFAASLAPPPDMPRMWAQLGNARLLAGDPAAALPALDAAIKADPNLARAIYYRARAEEQSGRTDAALADYSLASRTAFANAQNLASGEAHLYRGISFYRRKDYTHAEDEFASALNFGIPVELVADAEAWRHMAAVAGGACGASRQMLEESLAYSSPLFPKQEARAVAAGCPLARALP